MSRYHGGWAPYVPVAERRRRAEREMAKLRKSGHPVAPVTVAGRQIATTFWGRAWCDNLESYHDFENRLPRGRTYVRNGSVVDLQIAPGRVTATVSGSELYKVSITVKEAAKAHWRTIRADCAGGIDSLVALLQGQLSKGVMERLCRQQGGLFPLPSDLRFSCSCPDYAAMCKHVAAVLYGVGARLDHTPELLFRLRAVDETELLAGIDTALPLSETGPGAGRVLETEDVSALFGLDMAVSDAPAAANLRDKSGPVRGRGTPAEPEGVASATRTVAPRASAPPRASAVAPPGKYCPANRTTAAKNIPAKPNIPKQEPAVVRTISAAFPAPMPAATSTEPFRSAAAEKTFASAKIKGESYKSIKSRAPADASDRAAIASFATPAASEMPVQSGGKPSAASATATTIRKLKQKPVKWW
jgi:uncharacterized Zn finger protein